MVGGTYSKNFCISILNRQWKLIGVGAILLAIIGALVITQHNNKRARTFTV